MARPQFAPKAAMAYRQRFGIWPQEAAGLRELRLARGLKRGVLVGIYDGEAARLDTDGGRWSTVCETHSSICAHDTLALARRHASAPEGWCEDCEARQ